MNRPLRPSILVTLLASPMLQLLSGCLPHFDIVYLDTDEDGYTANVDCNDADASVYPGAVEIALDGVDQDCYGGDYADANDLDGDGYTADVDCDDEDASVYPGAFDIFGDGIDQSCDGSDHNAPSVGLPISNFRSIQEALDAAREGQTVWVGPGTYYEVGLTMRGRALRLASTQGEIVTVISGGHHQGTIFTFTEGESGASVLQGFTLLDGSASCNIAPDCTTWVTLGGGVYMDHASPTLTHINLVWNSAVYGGGMFLSDSSPTLNKVTFGSNRADLSGGGMYLSNASPILTDVRFRYNWSDGDGGGMSVYSSSPTLTHVTFTGNMVPYGSGGGMSLKYSSPTLTHVTFMVNEAYYAGGGMSLYNSSPTLQNSILAYNLAGSSGGNLYRHPDESTTSTVTANHSLLFNPSGWMVDNVTPSGSFLTVEPQFLDYADIGTGESCSPGSSDACRPSDLHLALGSPLVNAGDPTELDADGSRADIGSFGGQGGALWDVDLDGVPDYFWPGEWEDAPSGVDPLAFDRDDLDPEKQ